MSKQTGFPLSLIVCYKTFKWDVLIYFWGANSIFHLLVLDSNLLHSMNRPYDNTLVLLV